MTRVVALPSFDSTSLSVLFQPIVEVGGGSLHAFEALIRGPKGTALEAPELLFEHYRRLGQEIPVERACVSAVLKAARAFPHEIVLSLNVHAATLASDPEFPAFLEAEARKERLSPSRLIVEIVEHAPPWDVRRFRTALDAFRSLGVRIALDDVGLGHSNFRMILECRPDYFKLDSFFVQGASGDVYRQAILESVSLLARRFGATTVAEGIESEVDLAAVRAAGIDLAQGHLFLKASPATDCLANTLTAEGLSKRPCFAEGRRALPVPRGASGPKILLVDDSKTSLFIEQMILQQAQYQLVTAGDGQEAVEKAESERPDLILMDVMMPRMGGLEALQAIRHTPSTLHIPVILVTTRGEAFNVERGYESGCSDYVTKPVNAVELLAKVRKLLERGRHHPGAPTPSVAAQERRA
jgi:EAL domain-containing protein (putative c-di-GMP-specific phosphodiesterase class I)/CheY-like chemotaxis protein